MRRVTFFFAQEIVRQVDKHFSQGRSDSALVALVHAGKKTPSDEDIDPEVREDTRRQSDMKIQTFVQATEATARARMLVYLLENELIPDVENDHVLGAANARLGRRNLQIELPSVLR